MLKDRQSVEEKEKPNFRFFYFSSYGQFSVLLVPISLQFTNELAPFSAVRKSGTVQHHGRAPRFRESMVPNLLSNT